MAETPRKVCKSIWKGLHRRCFLHKKLRKAKIKTSQEQKTFCNANADADVNTDAYAEMPMLRFPNGRLKFFPSIWKIKIINSNKSREISTFNFSSLYTNLPYQDLNFMTMRLILFPAYIKPANLEPSNLRMPLASGYKLYDKTDNYPFFIVCIPDLSGKIPASYCA